MLFRLTRPKKKTTRGFSFVEMIVVIGIMALLSTVVIFDRRGFNDSIQLTSLAYDVALTIREAQVSGIAVKSYLEGSTLSFDKGYGINIQEMNILATSITYTPAANAVINNYVSFVDGATSKLNGNTFLTDYQYNHPNRNFDLDEGLQKRFTLGQGFRFQFCAHARTQVSATVYDYCSDGGTSGIEELHVTFKRPEPDAHLVFLSSGGSYPTELNNTAGSPNNLIDKVRIRISSATNSRDVIIYGNGQIAVCRSTLC